MLSVSARDLIASARALLLGVLSVLPVKVLDDPLRVVDDLVTIDEHRHARLIRQLLDLRPARTAVGNPLRSVLELELAEPPSHRPAGAEHVGGIRTSVKDDLP